MRFLTTLALSAVMAVATALPARAQQPIEGAWRLTHVDGRATAASSGEGDIVLSGLEFHPEGRLTATLSASRGSGAAPETADFSGTWSVEGDTLTLYIDMGATEADGDEPVSVRFAVRDGRLVIDAETVEYTFARP